ncbi:hypothetical protein Trydic_g13204 [Trypoxylus dichotomus]
MLLTIINKLGGMARDWFHSKPEHSLLTLEMLKSEMVKMLKSREDKITMMKKFEAGRWKKRLVEDDLINYIIDGMDNSILKTHAKVKELPHKLWGHRIAVVPPTTNTSTRPRSEVRCFNCNQKGHISNRCQRPKRDRGSCFECGTMRHQERNCPQRRGEKTTTPDSTKYVDGLYSWRAMTKKASTGRTKQCNM